MTAGYAKCSSPEKFFRLSRYITMLHTNAHAQVVSRGDDARNVMYRKMRAHTHLQSGETLCGHQHMEAAFAKKGAALRPMRNIYVHNVDVTGCVINIAETNGFPTKEAYHAKRQRLVNGRST